MYTSWVGSSIAVLRVSCFFFWCCVTALKSKDLFHTRENSYRNSTNSWNWSWKWRCRWHTCLKVKRLRDGRKHLSFVYCVIACLLCIVLLLVFCVLCYCFVCFLLYSCILSYYVCIAVSHTLVAGCWLEVSIRKVLRPATSAQLFLGFLVTISECWDGSQDSTLLLHASHVALPT